jgi:hypothetical protein
MIAYLVDSDDLAGVLGGDTTHYQIWLEHVISMKNMHTHCCSGQ